MPASCGQPAQGGEMEIYRGQTFEGKSFVLEEVAFINCKLADCDLFYSGGDFDWTNSNFDNCRFHWRGAAKNSLALLQSIGMIPPPLPPGAKPFGQKVN
jgi:hypothetical protein